MDLIVWQLKEKYKEQLSELKIKVSFNSDNCLLSLEQYLPYKKVTSKNYDLSTCSSYEELEKVIVDYIWLVKSSPDIKELSRQALTRY